MSHSEPSGGVNQRAAVAHSAPNGATVARVPDPHLTTLDDDPFLIELIARLTQQPTDEVRGRWQAELRSLGTNVRQELAERQLPSYEWSDRLVQFYEQTDAFLFETLSWNLCGAKQQMRRWIADFLARVYPSGARVLCYGDGMGFDSAYLASAGHDVVYYEVSDQCQAFAAELFARERVQVAACRSLDDFPAESFDAVVCLDVLEHVPDPPALVKDLTRQLREGGHLLVHAPFFYLSPAVCTHLKSNRKYSGDWRRLYGTSNLVPLDGELFWNPLALRKQPSTTPRPSLPMRVLVGGWLLQAARWWNQPHVFICEKLMSRADRRRLAERAARLGDSVQATR